MERTLMFDRQTFADLTGQTDLDCHVWGECGGCCRVQAAATLYGVGSNNYRPTGDSFWRNLRPSAHSINLPNLRPTLT